MDEEESNKNEVYRTLMKNIKLPRVELHIMFKEEFNGQRKSKRIKTIEEEGIKILNNNL